ncbi:putative aspartic peptidase A1 family, aspartic peptidase domain superfamily, xylanase inhibitor [Helianthus annuus]|nr:putative aspartic peptidase A1 family, aspartic peptidase domain superfamily, xylanase inhibitor [Helianthus annuus]
MLLLLQFFVLFLAFISLEYESITQYVPPYTTMVSPVHKHIDVATPLYSVQIDTLWEITRITPANFLIDIDAPFIWHDCIQQWNKRPVSCPMYRRCISPVSCEDLQCTKVRSYYSYKNPSCPPETNSSRLPGLGSCSCPVNVMNPLTKSCTQALLNYDDLIVNTTNGRNPFNASPFSTLNAACAPSSAFKYFPANVTGVMALSLSPYAFQTIFKQAAKKILALCLPSSRNASAPGVLFYGDGPYYFHPHSNVDITSFLSYTPLLKRLDSFGYFIRVNAIVIKQRSIEIPTNATTKLSTTKAYTTLRTDIYNRVVRRFSKVTKRLPLAKPVTPFKLCFRTLVNGTRVGLKVPDISFSLQDGKKWIVSTANSMKQITKHVACLAFVDGGATSEHGIEIGTFQFEDNFVVFDLEKSTFGFSSSLLKKQTSCANFNFTSIKRWY